MQNNSGKHIKSTLLFSLLAIGLFFLRYYDVLLTYKILGNSNDSVHLLGPVFKHVSDLLRSGQTPLFFQELLGGIPFYNNAMFSFTYPLYFFSWIDYGEGIDILRTITLVIVFHLFILYISNIILLRVIGFKPLVSIIAGFGIILCLNTTYNTPWIIAIAGYALTPLFFAGIIALFRYPRSYLGVLLLSIGSLCFLAKPAQTAILAIAFGGLITVVGAIAHSKEWKLFIPKFILAGFIIICLNGVGLLQLFLDFPDMMRFTTGGVVQGNSSIPLEAFKSQVALSQTGDYLLYMTKKIGVGHPFAGPLAIGSLFISIALLLLRRIKASWIYSTFLAITIFTIIIAYGKELPTFWIHYKTPLLNKIRESTRFLFITNIGFTVLIAYVLNHISDRWDRNKIPGLAILLLAFCIVCLFIQIHINTNGRFFTLIGIVAALSISIVFLRYRSRLVWMYTLLFTIAAFSFLLPNGRYGNSKEKGFESRSNLATIETFKQLSRKVKDVDAYRCMYTDDSARDGEWSNKGLYEGFRSLQGTVVVMPFQQYTELWHSDSFLNYRLFWGCRWFIYDKDVKQPIEDPNFDIVIRNKHHAVFENKMALDRAYFSKKVLPFEGDFKAFRNRLEKAEKVKPFTYVDPELIAVHKLQNNYAIENRVNSIDYFNNEITISTDQSKAGLLILNEYYSDNWVATINGKEKELIKVNVNQMAIKSPKGKNKISIEYKPYPFLHLLLAQKLAYVLLLLIGLFSIYKFMIRSNKVDGLA